MATATKEPEIEAVPGPAPEAEPTSEQRQAARDADIYANEGAVFATKKTPPLPPTVEELKADRDAKPRPVLIRIKEPKGLVAFKWQSIFFSLIANGRTVEILLSAAGSKTKELSMNQAIGALIGGTPFVLNEVADHCVRWVRETNEGPMLDHFLDNAHEEDILDFVAEVVAVAVPFGSWSSWAERTLGPKLIPLLEALIRKAAEVAPQWADSLRLALRSGASTTGKS